MNVSMQDAFNLGWKLAAVLRERSSPRLLHTYSAERQAIAKELIEFDREWAKMISAPPKDPAHPDGGGVDPAEFQAISSGRALHGGHGDALPPVDPHRRSDAPASGRRA